MEFRLDFFFKIIMDLFYHFCTLFIFRFLFLHTDLIAGWTEEQMIVFISSYILSDGLYMSFFATNCWWFPQYINKGDLDYYLTRPVSPLFFLGLREFAANSFVNLIVAVGIFTWSLSNLTMDINIWRTLLYTLLVINGVVIFSLIQLACYLPVFWTQSPRGFEQLFYGVNSMMKYPDKIHTTLFRFFFTFILPMNAVLSLPARFYFDENYRATFGIIILVTFFTWFLFLKLWKLALKQYSSASS